MREVTFDKNGNPNKITNTKGVAVDPPRFTDSWQVLRAVWESVAYKNIKGGRPYVLTLKKNTSLRADVDLTTPHADSTTENNGDKVVHEIGYKEVSSECTLAEVRRSVKDSTSIRRGNCTDRSSTCEVAG
ncbi:MAG: hypothetical protein MR209_07010 [Veillonellaceae bacterium]|nr:hypothetical protein [Veillonellaceae bacterium]